MIRKVCSPDASTDLTWQFLDAQQIVPLTSFLEELHARKLANSAHTSLLLNCIAKLKDTARLDAFIKADDERPETAEEGGPPFDLETAIRVLRQAGYPDHALYLARRYQQHEVYLRIQLEDRDDWLDALRYLRALGGDIVERNVTRYGKRLIAHAPERTTELLIDLCCGTLARADEAVAAETAGAASYLSYLTKAAPTLAKSGSQGAAGAAAAPTVTSPDVATATNRRSGIVTGAFDVPNSVTAASVPTTDLPSPRRFFALFIDRPDLLVTFLETVAARRWGQELSATPQLVTAAPLQAPSPAVERDQQAVWTTLLELYLGPTTSSEAKALQVLRQSDRLPYDATQALLICTTASFVPGLMLLYERLGMQDDIVRFWMARADGGDDPRAMGEVMAALRRFGPDRPHLYPLVLRFLSGSAARVAAHQDDLLSVLDHVAREKVMPPIAVVQCLARTEATSVGLVREYLKRQIIAEREEIDAVRSRP